MHSKHLLTGKIGEDIACGYLVNNGYRIIHRNFKTKFGELDVIAESPDKTLVFIEVKTKSDPSGVRQIDPASYPQFRQGLAETYDSFLPEDQMTPHKIDKFKRISEWYANENPRFSMKGGYRLDVIALVLSEPISIRHYQNI